MTSFSYPLLQVDWQEVHAMLKWQVTRDQLTMKVSAKSLPYITTCPRCQGRLGIYQDTIYQGVWFDCTDCDTRGDPVEFAAKCWDIPLRDAALRLVPTATPEELGVYEKTIERHKEVAAFWKMAKNQVLYSSDLRPLRLRFGISPTTQADAWGKRGGGYLGCASREEIDRLVGHRSEWHSIFWKSKVTGADSRDRVKGDLLVLPLCDVPNRISSFLFVRRNSKGEDEFVHYRCLAVNHPGGKQRPTPAVFALDMVPRQLRNAKFNESLLVLDPLLAANLVVKHLAEHTEASRVVGIWPDAPPCQLLKDLCPTRRITLWSHKADFDLFKHAVALDAHVVVSSAGREDVYKQISRYRHEAWVTMQVAAGQHWRHALEDQLAQLPVIDAESLLLRLEIPPAHLKQFLDECRPTVRSSLKGLYAERCLRRTIMAGSHSIREEEGCWYVQPTQSPLSNATVKIENVIVQGDKAYCQGTVHCGGKEAAFLVDQKILTAPRGWTWLEDFMLKEGLGILNSRWNRKPSVYAIATAFHTPQVRHAASHAGWHEDLPGFAFPEFSIRVGGEVEVQATPWPKTAMLTDAAADLRRPTGLEIQDIRALSEGVDAKLAWTMSLVVLHNILADAWGFATKGIALTGTAQVAATRLAQALGCPATAVDKSVREWRHGFPLLVEGMTTTAESRNRWLAEAQHNHVVPLSPFHSRLCTVYGGWLRLDVDRPLEAGTHMVEAARKVVPNYLLDLAQRKMQTWTHDTDVLDRIVKDVAGWFGKQGGDANAVWAGDRKIVRDGPTEVAAAFAGMLCKLLDDAKMTFERAGFSGKPSKKEAMIYSDETVWVPQVGVQAILRAERLAPLDISRVSRGLDEAGALAGEAEHRGQPGWLVREQWWNDRLREWRTQVAYRRAISE